VVTAQHREMLDQVLDLFGIVPDHDLDLMRPGQSLGAMTVRALNGLGQVLDAELPDAVLVQGDTTTTFVGALAAFYRQLPIVHVEAGLRTGDSMNPYPEEMNRRLTTRLATLHLAATSVAAANLVAEGVDVNTIRVTGNTVIDALQWALQREPPNLESELDLLLKRIPLRTRLVLVTAHRRESWGKPMEQIGAALSELARRHPEIHFIFPIHRNPLVRKAIAGQISLRSNVHLIEPLDYCTFCIAMRRAHLILTDSGGVQEEAPALGVPVLVMRDTTERTEAIEAGTARLVGTACSAIVTEVERLLTDESAHARMAKARNPFGDGRASERIVAAVAAMLRQGSPLPDFES
jgi:UDP-N-acetylglucosamine 2-epimerase (non-hydrolysing)